MTTTGFAVGAIDFVNAVAVQADGKIIAAGDTQNAGNQDIAVARYNVDGSLDTSFGGGTGKITTVIGANSELAQSVLLFADGKILVAGSTYAGASSDIVLVCYNADGSLDTTFGGGTGIASSGLAGSDEGLAVSVQSDGKILVAGKDNNNFLLVRFLANGTLDAAFGSGGKVSTDFAGGTDIAYSMTLQSDGKIVLGGLAFNGTSFDFGVARYNVDGTLDTTFNGSGKTLVDFGASGDDQGRSMTMQADGKILVAGWSNAAGTYDFALMRLNTDGSLDTSFNGTGKTTTAIGTGSDLGLSVTVQSDGKILVAGQSNSNGGNFAVARYNSDGSLDTTFNGTGKVDTNFGGSSDDRGAAVAVQADGRIVIAGTSTINGNHDFAVVRYNADGSLDARFNTSDTLGGSVSYIENAAAVVLDSDVTIFDAELSALNNFSGATLTLARNGGANAQDLFSATGLLAAITQGSSLVYSGTTIGTVSSNGGGTLVLSFNGNATQALINAALRSIAYTNSSDDPPVSVQIVWTFNDGNSGVQGSGGALTASGTTTVNITSVNDAPVRSAGTLADLVVAEDTAATSLGLTALAYTPASGGAEAAQTLTYTVTAVPLAALGNITLADGSTVVTVNTSYTLTELRGMKFLAAANANGGPLAFSWKVVDSGGTANGGIDILNESLTITVTSVNDAPSGTSDQFTSPEDQPRIFIAGDFGFVDPDVGDTLDGVRIDTLPGGGTLSLSGTPLTVAGTVVSRADIDAGRLIFTPGADENGSPYTTFTFSVRDTGGLYDASPKIWRSNISAVNDAPVASGSATLAAINEDTTAPAGATVSALFVGNFSDSADQVSGGSSADTFNGIAISSHTANASQGSWQYSSNGGSSWNALGNATTSSAITLNATDLLRFVPAADYSGAATALAAHLIESGLAISSGATLDLSGATGGVTHISAATVALSETINAVNDAPVRSAGTVNNLMVVEDTAATSLGLGSLAYGPGGGSDESGQTLTYTVTAVPAAALGVITLADGSTVVTASTVYSLAQLQGMKFLAAPDASGGPAAFSWKVVDSGGTGNGGVDNLNEALTITVTPINDAPTTTPVVLAPIAEDSGARLITQVEL
ncbi:MAG: Ig-like domain-containing protein, partial [Propionivibrio sp.]